MSQEGGSTARALEALEARAVDAILAGRPLQLPRRNLQVANGEACVIYRGLGIRLGRRGGGPVTVPAHLPPGWTCRRIGSRGIEVCDEDQASVFTAFYKLTPYETKAHIDLTAHGMDLLRRRWAALPHWRRFLTRPGDGKALRDLVTGAPPAAGQGGGP